MEGVISRLVSLLALPLHLPLQSQLCVPIIPFDWFVFLFSGIAKHLRFSVTLILFLSLVLLPSSYKSIAAPCSPGQLVHSCCSQPGMWDGDRRDSSSLFQWTWSQKTPDRRVQWSGSSPNWSHHVYSATRTGNQWMKNQWEELEWCGVGMGWQEP